MIINDFKPAISVFQEVGLKIKTWRNNSKYRKIYSELNMKTEADLQSHHIIFSKLSELYPGVEIISEENFSDNNLRPKTYWLVDPIDGTASWYNGFNGYVTQASFIFNSKPIFGIVYAPEFQKTWVGIKGEGAKLNGSIIKNVPLPKKLVFIDNTNSPHGITKKLMDIMGSDDYLESGSIGLKSVFVADVTADLFIKDVVVRDWDLAPAYVILNEVGCSLALASGKDYVFNGSMEKNEGFVVARNSSLLNKVISLINTI